MPPPHAQQNTRRHHTTHRLSTGIATAALILGGLGIAITFASAPSLPAGTQRDQRGDAVIIDPGEAPGPSTLKRMNPTVDAGERIVIPSVHLDAPLGAINTVAGVVTPPGFTAVYAIRNLGTRIDQPDNGTVFLVTHSLRGGGTAPGNALIDLEHHRSAVEPGAKIIVAGTAYTATGSQTIAKPDLAKAAGLWADTPGRLVIITCLQRPNGAPSVDNLVIIATKG